MSFVKKLIETNLQNIDSEIDMWQKSRESHKAGLERAEKHLQENLAIKKELEEHLKTLE
jgi:hypothetical protein